MGLFHQGIDTKSEIPTGKKRPLSSLLFYFVTAKRDDEGTGRTAT